MPASYFLLTLLWIHNAAAYYCDFNICEPSQHCCGDNKCCSKVIDLWYFWVGIILVVFLVLLLIFFTFYKLYKSKPKAANYRYTILENT